MIVLVSHIFGIASAGLFALAFVLVGGGIARGVVRHRPLTEPIDKVDKLLGGVAIACAFLGLLLALTASASAASAHPCEQPCVAKVHVHRGVTKWQTPEKWGPPDHVGFFFEVSGHALGFDDSLGGCAGYVYGRGLAVRVDGCAHGGHIVLSFLSFRRATVRVTYNWFSA